MPKPSASNPGTAGQGDCLTWTHRAARGAARHVLGLAAAAVGGRHQTPGRVVGGGHSEVAAQDVQAQVDAGGGAGRGEHAALVDEQHVLVDLDERMPGHECPRVVPVRRGSPAVEQARGGEREGARRDGGESRAPVVGGDQRVDDSPRRVVAVREPVAGDEDDVGPRERVEAVGDVVREAVAAGHRPGAAPHTRTSYGMLARVEKTGVGIPTSSGLAPSSTRTTTRCRRGAGTGRGYVGRDFDTPTARPGRRHTGRAVFRAALRSARRSPGE